MCPMHKNRISKSIVTYLIIERKNVDCSAAVIVNEVSFGKINALWIKQVGITELGSYTLTYKTLQRRLS